MLLFTTAMLSKGNTAIEGLSVAARSAAIATVGAPTDAVGPHRIGDVFQGVSADIIEPNVDLVPDIVIAVAGNEDAARLGEAFETHGNIDTVTEDIIVCDDNITDVNSDAKFDPFVLRHVGISFCHTALNFDGTSNGVDHAGELNECAVPGILDDASAMISDFGIEKRPSESFQLRHRAFFVDPY